VPIAAPSRFPLPPLNTHHRGIRSAQAGLLVNAVLAAIKLVAGIVGNAYVLVADAVESTADILGSAIVWGGLRISAQPADDDHPYGHGKAEALAAAVVAVMMLGAAVGISIEAVEQIRTPHDPPASWTLGVLVAVILVKWILSRRVHAVGHDIGSTAVRADAWHHMSDAITSAAAFVGISLALWGSRSARGAAWASADDWAAILAAAIIAVNAITLLRAAVDDLMDRMPGDDVVAPVRRVARQVDGVRDIEKLWVRKAGLSYRVTIHVQADAEMRLDDAHALGHRVQQAILDAEPRVASVLVHMEPWGEGRGVRG